MNENEEFEFRLRLEQEGTTPSIPERLKKGAVQDVKDIVGTVEGMAEGVKKAPIQTALAPFMTNINTAIKGGQTAQQMMQGRPFMNTPIGQDLGEFGQMVKKLPENIMDPINHPVKAGIDAATILLPAGKAAKAGLASKAASKMGFAVAKGVEKAIGISADKIATVFKKPLELFLAPTSKDVAKAYSASELKAVEKTVAEIAEAGSATNAAVVKRAARTIVKQAPIDKLKTGKQLLDGRQALDAQIASLESKLATAKEGRSALQRQISDKLALRQQFNFALDGIAPQHRAADAVFARQAGVEPFRSVTLPGKVSFTSPEGIARAIPGLPTAVGLGVSGLGAAYKAGTGAANLVKRAAPRMLLSQPFTQNKDK